MGFRELLEKYKDGSATPEERGQVEQELEKYDALTEYMLGQDFAQEGQLGQQPERQPGQQPEPPVGELQKIRRNIKRRNTMLVCLAAGMACGVVAAACWFGPAISKRLWYDPTEVYNPGSDDFSTQKIDSHIAALSELTMPETRSDPILIEERGSGKYDLTFFQWDFSRAENNYTYGSVDQGKIELHRDFWQFCMANIFTRSQYGFREEPAPDRIIRDVGSAREILEGLPEYIQLEAYISLRRDWDMEEFAAFFEKITETPVTVGWTAVRTAPEDEQILPLAGFQAGTGGYVFNEVDALYPYYEMHLHKDEPMAKVFSEHFKTLLHYTIDHKDFYREKMDFTMRDEEMLEYVEQNGVNTYGFVCYGSPQEILQVLDEPDVEGVYISDSRISVP